MSAAGRVVGFACAFLGMGTGVFLLFADGDAFGGLFGIIFGVAVFAIAWGAE